MKYQGRLARRRGRGAPVPIRSPEHHKKKNKKERGGIAGLQDNARPLADATNSASPRPPSLSILGAIEFLLVERPPKRRCERERETARGGGREGDKKSRGGEMGCLDPVPESSAEEKKGEEEKTRVGIGRRAGESRRKKTGEGVRRGKRCITKRQTRMSCVSGKS